MALVKPPLAPIEIELKDRVINDTVLKQKAVYIGLTHDPVQKRVQISLQIKVYANKAGLYGEELTDKGFAPRFESLVADNNTIVEAATGKILHIAQGYIAPADLEAVANAYTQDTMLQGDFFEIIKDSHSIIIGDMIKQHIHDADAMGKFV